MRVRLNIKKAICGCKWCGYYWCCRCRFHFWPTHKCLNFVIFFSCNTFKDTHFNSNLCVFVFVYCDSGTNQNWFKFTRTRTHMYSTHILIMRMQPRSVSMMCANDLRANIEDCTSNMPFQYLFGWCELFVFLFLFLSLYLLCKRAQKPFLIFNLNLGISTMYSVH